MSHWPANSGRRRRARGLHNCQSVITKVWVFTALVLGSCTSVAAQAAAPVSPRTKQEAEVLAVVVRYALQEKKESGIVFVMYVKKDPDAEFFRQMRSLSVRVLPASRAIPSPLKNFLEGGEWKDRLTGELGRLFMLERVEWPSPSRVEVAAGWNGERTRRFIVVKKDAAWKVKEVMPEMVY